MAVDPIIRKDKRLHAINPYFRTGCVYGIFNSMSVNGKPILDSLNEMYTGAKMIEFMEQGYAYCTRHEAEIRAQIGDTV